MTMTPLKTMDTKEMSMKTMMCRTIERVQCRFLFTSSRPDVGQVIKLQFHSAMKCSDGNFTVYDGEREEGWEGEREEGRGTESEKERGRERER